MGPDRGRSPAAGRLRTIAWGGMPGVPGHRALTTSTRTPSFTQSQAGQQPMGQASSAVFTDFGPPPQTEPAEPLTADGAIVGTLSYLAPELAVPDGPPVMQGPAWSGAFAAVRKTLATGSTTARPGSGKGEERLWEVESGRRLGILVDSRAETGVDPGVRANGKLLAVRRPGQRPAGARRRQRQHDARPGRPRGRGELHRHLTGRRDPGQPRQRGRTIKPWDLATFARRSRRRRAAHLRFGHDQPVRAPRLRPGRATLASGGRRRSACGLAARTPRSTSSRGMTLPSAPWPSRPPTCWLAPPAMAASTLGARRQQPAAHAPGANGHGSVLHSLSVGSSGT